MVFFIVLSNLVSPATAFFVAGAWPLAMLASLVFFFITKKITGSYISFLY